MPSAAMAPNVPPLVICPAPLIAPVAAEAKRVDRLKPAGTARLLLMAMLPPALPMEKLPGTLRALMAIGPSIETLPV